MGVCSGARRALPKLHLAVGVLYHIFRTISYDVQPYSICQKRWARIVPPSLSNLYQYYITCIFHLESDSVCTIIIDCFLVCLCASAWDSAHSVAWVGQIGKPTWSYDSPDLPVKLRSIGISVKFNSAKFIWVTVWSFFSAVSYLTVPNANHIDCTRREYVACIPFRMFRISTCRW
jgi:hypothetical protein